MTGNDRRGQRAGKAAKEEDRRDMRRKPWQVRLLTGAKKAACRELWEEIFTEDSERFLDYYGRWKYPENECFGIFDGGRLVSMAQFNPYEIRIRGSASSVRTVKSHYIVAVATGEEYRHKGMMAAILRESLGRMREEGMPFVFLMPAAEAIYRPFGFRYFYESNTGTLAPCGAAGEADREAGGEKTAVRPAVSADIPGLVTFSEEILQELFDCYTKRDRHYYEMLLAELASEDGGLLLVTEPGPDGEKEADGRILAAVPYWGTDPAEIREILCRPREKERVLLALGRWFGSVLPGERPERVSAAGAPFPMGERKPVIMGRIADAVSFLELFSAEQETEILLELADDLLEENSGLYLWSLSREGSRARRLSLPQGEILRAAEVRPGEAVREPAGGDGRMAGAPSGREMVRTTPAELFSCLMGGREPEGALRKVRACRRSYINEIV